MIKINPDQDKVYEEILKTLFPWGNFIKDFDTQKINEIFEKNLLPRDILDATYDFITFRKALDIESDRGAALLAASHLEFILEQLLRKKLIGSTKELKLMFDFSGPLGTFSSRVLMCYSMGLISRHVFLDIQIIRKIRNKFGHTPRILTFDDKSVSGLCSSLKSTVYVDISQPRNKFINTVSAVSAQIQAETMVSEKIDKHQDFNLDVKTESLKN